MSGICPVFQRPRHAVQGSLTWGTKPQGWTCLTCPILWKGSFAVTLWMGAHHTPWVSRGAGSQGNLHRSAAESVRADEVGLAKSLSMALCPGDTAASQHLVIELSALSTLTHSSGRQLSPLYW